VTLSPGDVLGADRELLDQLLALRAEQETLAGRLAKLDDERTGVSQVVWTRVQRDYEGRLAALAERGRTLEQALQEPRQRVADRRAALQAALDNQRHDEEELRLRARLGELDEAELAKRLAPLSPALAERQAELASVEEVWGLLESVPATPPAAAAELAAPVPPFVPAPIRDEPVLEEPAPPSAPPPPPAPRGQDGGLTTAVDVPQPPVTSSQATMLISAQLPAPAGPTVIFRPAVLVSERPIDRRRELPVEPLTTLGRGVRNQIRLQEPAVSTRHAEIRLTADGYRVYDLKSTNGTFVNGERVDEAPLADGDRLMIGTFAFDFRLPQG
jgi:hypothetical protein